MVLNNLPQVSKLWAPWAPQGTLGESFTLWVIHFEGTGALRPLLDLPFCLPLISPVLSLEVHGIQVGSTVDQLMPSLYFQPNQKAMDNFDTVDLSWLRHTMDPLEVLRHGVSFLEDPSKLMTVIIMYGATYTLLLPSRGSQWKCIVWRKSPIGPRGSAWGLLQTPWSLELLT